MKLDEALYYTLADPTGTSLVIADENGLREGHLLYDSYGGVLSSSLTSALEEALADQGSLLDPDIGLVHLGNGRWYDPSMGRPLQPDPIGGPPSVPQALNRYAATSVGQPGVAQGAVSQGLNPLLVTAGKGVFKSFIGATVGKGLAAIAQSRFPLVVAHQPAGTELTLIMSAIARNRYFPSGAASPFEGGGVAMTRWGRTFRAYTVRGLVTEIEPGLFLTDSGELVETGALPKSAAVLTAEMLRPVNITRFIAGGSFAFVLSAGMQYLGDVGNPYLSGEQIRRRVFIAGVGGTVAWGIGTTTALVFTGPVGIGAGFVAGFIWFAFVQPQIFENRDLNPQRNLAPLP